MSMKGNFPTPMQIFPWSLPRSKVKIFLPLQLSIHVRHNGLRPRGCQRTSMSHNPDKQVLGSVQRDVEAAIDLLRTLSKIKSSHLVGKSQRLPVEELQLAAGLVFIFSTKVGLLASALAGRGLLLKRLPGSSSGWSAPLLLDVKSVGFGAVAGLSKTSSLAILDTEHAVQNFLHTQASLDSEMTVAAGPAGREMHSSELNIIHPTETFSGAVYSVAQGAMIDVSFQGVKVSIRRGDMQKLYGADVNNADVLSGKVAQLPSVMPLLQEVLQLSRGGAAPAARVA